MANNLSGISKPFPDPRQANLRRHSFFWPLSVSETASARHSIVRRTETTKTINSHIAQSFPFLELPKVIQLQVWDNAAKRSRVTVHIYIDENPLRIVVKPDIVEPDALLRACRDSRQAMKIQLENAPWCFKPFAQYRPLPPAFRSLYFDPYDDLFYIHEEKWALPQRIIDAVEHLDNSDVRWTPRGSGRSRDSTDWESRFWSLAETKVVPANKERRCDVVHLQEVVRAASEWDSMRTKSKMDESDSWARYGSKKFVPSTIRMRPGGSEIKVPHKMVLVKFSRDEMVV